MSLIDYKSLASTVTSTLAGLGTKFTFTLQPEGTSTSVQGVLIDKPDSNVTGTNVLYKTAELLLPPTLKTVPKPGDWFVRAGQDTWVVQSVIGVSPAGTVVLYKVQVAM